jgi:FlaA1/EpsC-like NDP-sugar epimerase
MVEKAHRIFESSVAMALSVARNRAAWMLCQLLWHEVGIAVAVTLALLFRFEFVLPSQFGRYLTASVGLGILGYGTAIIGFRLWVGLWSFFGYRDCVRHVWGLAVGGLLYAALFFVANGFSFQGYPRSTFFTSYLILLSWEIGGRLVLRFAREQTITGPKNSGTQSRCLLVGNCRDADCLLRSLQHVMRVDTWCFVGIISDDNSRIGATLHGVKVHGTISMLGEVAERERADTILVIPPFTSPGMLKNLIDECSKRGLACVFRMVPSIEDLASGKLDVSLIRKVELEDLLNRSPVTFDSPVLSDFITGRSVMVTGAGGSIGSELCRQVLKYEPKQLVLFEHNEFSLFEIERELASANPDIELLPIAGDVKRHGDVARAIRRAGAVNVVYHAAAYKHVHLMEKNVPAVIYNNVIGSKVLAEASHDAGVSDFILISTDKAVRPTSIMGASKRLAERVILEHPLNGMSAKTVRFGNVLGSSGSVIPIFKQQIAEGGPVTVTSTETRRFFMTIPEAVQLVMMAGAVGKDRDIMVLEMGDPVKIDTLARRMIELSGLRPDVDIKIEYIGLRPGEKEYEELLTNDEHVVPTEHERICVFRKTQENGSPLNGAAVDSSRMMELIDAGDDEGLREIVRSLVEDNLFETGGASHLRPLTASTKISSLD